MRLWAAAAVALFATSLHGCGSDTEAELAFDVTLPFALEATPDPAAADHTWATGFTALPEISLRRGYGVLVLLPAPLGTEEEVVEASLTAEFKGVAPKTVPLPVIGKDTSVRIGVNGGALSKITVRVKSKTGAPVGPAPLAARVAIGAVECLNDLQDAWQAQRFGTERVRMAYASECVRK